LGTGHRCRPLDRPDRSPPDGPQARGTGRGHLHPDRVPVHGQVALRSPVPDGTTCSSKNVTGSTDGTATTAYGEFELPGQVADFADACNPAKWPLCSWFFIGMTLQPNPPKVSLSAPDDIGGNAYEAVMHEEVGMEGVLTVSTYLTCRYFVGQDSVGMEFDLAPGTHGDGKIDVDHGYLLAEQIDPNTVRVRSQKTFSFVGLDDLPFSWLCSFGWIDMMRGMATCRP
jgi:hypothetical protein